MSLAAEAGRVEAEMEKQCALILKTDNEFWEIRNKAILALTELVGRYEKHANVQDILGMSVFRLLKEPIKNMIADLRSQQVRDTCAFLVRLSQIVGDHMRHFLRDSFAFILDGVKVPNKVMSGFVDECIMNMIKNTTFKTGIHILVSEIRDSKAKVVRERCLVSMNSRPLSLSPSLSLFFLPDGKLTPSLPFPFSTHPAGVHQRNFGALGAAGEGRRRGGRGSDPWPGGRLRARTRNRPPCIPQPASELSS